MGCVFSFTLLIIYLLYNIKTIRDTFSVPAHFRF
nr:MAG TPA: hypothetical protein [Caudoviricetes sp.]